MRTLEQLQNQIALIAPSCSVESRSWNIRVQLCNCIVPLEFEPRADHPDDTFTSPSGDILAPLQFKVSACIAHTKGLRVGQELTSAAGVSLGGTHEYVVSTRGATKTYTCTSELGVTTVRRTA